MSTTEDCREPATRRGLFITFEGADGCGKTTQMRLLARRLRSGGHPVLETSEPGGTSIGTKIRRILLDAENIELCPTAELLLYFASRAQNVEEMILPALDAGHTVLSDRFTDSTLAYQGCARGLGWETVLTLDKIACHGLAPDITILVDIDPETGLARARQRNLQFISSPQGSETRMEDEATEFHRKVSKAYAELVKREPKRFRVVDGRQDVDTVASAIWDIVGPLVSRHNV